MHNTEAIRLWNKQLLNSDPQQEQSKVMSIQLPNIFTTYCVYIQCCGGVCMGRQGSSCYWLWRNGMDIPLYTSHNHEYSFPAHAYYYCLYVNVHTYLFSTVSVAPHKPLLPSSHNEGHHWSRGHVQCRPHPQAVHRAQHIRCTDIRMPTGRCQVWNVWVWRSNNSFQKLALWYKLNSMLPLINASREDRFNTLLGQYCAQGIN